MISDGNILRLLYFLFFILSSWSSIHCPFFNHTLANFENKNKWIFLQLAKLLRRNYFFDPYIYILRVARLLSLLVFVFKFCLSHVIASAPAFLTEHFQWNFLGGEREQGAFYTFSCFLSRVRHRGGEYGTSAILCICLYVLSVKKIRQCKALPLFFCSNFFFLLLLVSCFYTSRPFQIVLFDIELWSR